MVQPGNRDQTRLIEWISHYDDFKHHVDTRLQHTSSAPTMVQSVHDTLESVSPDDEPDRDEDVPVGDHGDDIRPPNTVRTASVQQQQQRPGSHSTSRDGQIETGTNPEAAIFVPIATQEATS